MHVRMSFLCTLILTLSSAAGAAVLEVEGPQDSLAGAPTINHCTLRKAIINANDDAATYPQCAAGSGADTITFLGPMTISLTLSGAGEDAALTGDLDITSSVTITGNGTIIDGAGLDRIFHINPLNSATAPVVTLNNLHLRNGSGLGGGGAILANNATVNLNGVTISGSRANMGDGGAILMTNSAVLNMTNSTISGNSAAFHAGAMVLEGGATITSCTITGNSSDTGLTGGVRAFPVVSLRNSIVAGNTNSSAVNDIPNLDGTFTSLGYNVVGDLGSRFGAAVDANPVIVATTGDQFGVSLASINLGPLQVNGSGPATRALLTGSIAIDKGHSSGSTTDERGLTRPCDDLAIANATGGDGADVGAFELQAGVCSPNTDPTANPDPTTVAEDSGSNSIDVLGNDTDAEGDTLLITSVTQGTHGAVVNNGSSVAYTPSPNYFGPDSFTYTISDGNGGVATGTVPVTVTNVQDVPDAVNDSTTILEDSGANTIAVRTNDNDADGDTLSITSVAQGVHGAVATDGLVVSYAPAPDFFGSDTFTYTISDGQGGSDTATVSVTVTNVNDAPTAAANAYTVNQDTTLNVPAPGVLGNDNDLDGDPLTAALTANVVHGLLALSPGGGFSYAPNPSFAGTDSFSYKANDGLVDSNAAVVTIHVLDTQPPAITAAVGVGSMWPPDHKLINVGLSVSVSDNSGGPVTTQIDVFSDEDDVTSGGGEQSPDAKNIGSGTLRLRAERNGSADGRVYLIRIRATDPSSNTGSKCLGVVVPKSQSAAHTGGVNLQAMAAATQCTATGVPPAGYVLVGDGPVNGPHQ